jgi:uncharacterized protein (DUF1778 family)
MLDGSVIGQCLPRHRHQEFLKFLRTLDPGRELVGWLDNPMLYCHCEYMSMVKEERLQIRVGPADKALLERAAAASHLNVSAFVVQAAASKAEEILAERSSIRLSREAALAFTEALERPAGVNDRLASAMRRTRTFSWLD